MINSSSAKLILCSLITGFLLISFPAKSQRSVGIGTREPNANAALEIVATDKDQGVLIPGLTTDERLNTSFVARLGEAENGLLVFDRDEQRFYYWMTDRWQAMISGTISQNIVAGRGIEIIGNDEIVNTGDTDSTDDITNTTLASGDLGGTFPELTIVPAAVVTDKLADGAVTTLKIADNTILPQDMASPGAGKVLVTTSAGTVFWENQSLFGITFLQQGRVYVGDSGNQPSEVDMRGEGNILVGNGTSATSVPVSGDISLTSTGNAQIQPETVSSLEIENLGIATEDLADAVVTTDKVQDAAITNLKIADDAVNAAKVADASIGSDELATASVGSDEIQDNSIVNADVSSSAAIAGTKINPDFGSQNISTTGNLSAGSAAFTAKATSEATLGSDPNTTLTTKSYVDTEISSISNNLVDGDGITGFTYNGSAPRTVSIDAGRGLGFDAGQLVLRPGPGLDFDGTNQLQVSGVNTGMITDGTILNADINTAAAVQISKLESLGNARIVVGDGTTNNSVLISGDATMDASGQLTLTAGAASTLGLGSMAVQDANAVTISGGSIAGITDLAVADGGTGASNTAAARTNLGLGTIAVQDANSVSISGGSVDGAVIGGSSPTAGTFTTLTATSFSGNGSTLTNLNADNIASGTLADARLNNTGPGAGVYGAASSEYINSIELDDKGRVVAVVANVPASDRRLKENLLKIKSSLPQILQLEPYQYNWKEQPDAGISFGLIAQELAQVYPHLVKKRSDGYLGVNYLELIPFLIKAIQEQQDQIEGLKEELAQSSGQAKTSDIEQLKEENRQLRQEIEAIKAALGLGTSTDSQ